MADLGYEVDLTPQAGKASGESDQPHGMTPERAASYWTQQIVLAEREHKPYWAECDEIVDLYLTARKKKGQTGRRRMNILYANTETVRGAIYARSGKPDIRPRFATANPVASQGAEILERCISSSIDTREHENAIVGAVLYAILAGRGVVWVDYEPTLGDVVAPLAPLAPVAPETDDALGRDAGEVVAEPPPIEAAEAMVEQGIVAQRIVKTMLEPRDFLHSPARQWSEVWWIARRHRMTRDDLKSNGFKRWQDVPLNWVPTKDGKPDHEASDDVRRAEVWEVWSRTHRQRVFVARDFDTALRVDDDPYGLEQFWPVAEPLTLTSPIGNVIPALEWNQYSELADDLEETMNRISKLTSSMKRRGVRDAAIKELERLAKANDNEFVPVQNYQHLVQKGGLAGAFQTEDLKPLIETLLELYKAKEQIEASIDKMTGIADIMRGEGQASETATAQQIKAQYGGIRIRQRQRAVQIFIRDLLRIEAELIAEHFEPDIIAQMTEMEVSPDVVAMLRNDRARRYKIDVESDSTVLEDADGTRQAIAEAIQASVGLMKEGVAIMQAAPEMGEVVFEMLSMSLRTMKGGRQIEDIIDRARQSMQQRQSLPPEPQHDPRMETERVRAEADQFAAQAKMQQTEMGLQAAREKHQQAMDRLQAQQAFAQFQPPMQEAMQ